MKTFEESTPKPRRLSAPSRVVWRSIGDPCNGVRKLDFKRAIALPKSSNDLVMDVDVVSADSPREIVLGNKGQQVSLDGTVPGSQVYPDVVSKPLSMDVTLNSSSNDAVPTIPVKPIYLISCYYIVHLFLLVLPVVGFQSHGRRRRRFSGCSGQRQG